MSYEDPSAGYFSGRHSAKQCLLTKKGMFPTGLIYVVQGFLKDTSYTLNDTRAVPLPRHGIFKMSKGVTPYPEQNEAVEAATRLHHGIIAMPTGMGKSITMALLTNALQVRTLIVVPNLNLKEQLTETFLRLFGNLDNVTIENIDSPRLPKATNSDCLIIDEAHHAAASTYRTLNKTAWAGIYYRFFFTATPFRSQEH